MLVLNIISTERPLQNYATKFESATLFIRLDLTVLGTLFKEDDFENAKGFCDVIPII